mgnify:CR=1 FL=1
MHVRITLDVNYEDLPEDVETFDDLERALRHSIETAVDLDMLLNMPGGDGPYYTLEILEADND